MAADTTWSQRSRHHQIHQCFERACASAEPHGRLQEQPVVQLLLQLGSVGALTLMRDE